jgi:hypothetical protein
LAAVNRLAVVSFVVLVGCSDQAVTPSPAPSPKATAQVISSANPSLGPTPGSVSYMNAVSAEDEALIPLVTAVGENCNDTTPEAVCRKVISNMRDGVRAFEQELAGVTPPVCMADYDRRLRAALSDFDQGDTLGIKGIDENKPAEVAEGAGMVTAGNQVFPTRTDITQAFAQCLQTGG